MPPLHLRQEFPTLKAFKEALHAWAIEAHFEPRILKSDTGRVRVGCKRDPNCPFVIRCNWERKNGREPLARVTVLRERHSCLNGVDWQGGMMGAGMNGGMGGMGGPPGGGSMGGGMGGLHMPAQISIRQDSDGNVLGGARVLGPIGRDGQPEVAVPVLPKVQRNSASRLPFLMEILPRLMQIQKETTPMEIRECLLREYGAEVHLQQCRRAKTEILKKREGELGRGQGGERMRSADGGSEGTAGHEGGGMYADGNGNGRHSSGTPNQQGGFALHAANGVVAPVVPEKSAGPGALGRGEQPVKCPYCINLRWMSSIKDAVEHMSMHVVV